MAAPTFVDMGANGVNGGNANTAVLNFTGTGEIDIVGESSNDVAVAALYKESTSAVTAPSGWNLLGTFDQDTLGFRYRAYIYWRRLDGTEGSAVTWSWTGNTWRYIECYVWRNGVTNETPVINVTADEETAQNSNPVHPGITIARSNSGLLWFVFNFSDVGNTGAPTGFTYRQPASNSLSRNILTYDDLTTSPGASGTVTGNLSGDIEYPLTVLMELITEAAAKATPPLRRPNRVWTMRIGR